MKELRFLISISFLGMLAAAPIQAEVIVDNLDQPISAWGGPIGTDDNNNDALLGQEFTLPAGNYANYTINKVTLLLSPLGGYASVTVSIWNVDSNNNPGNEIAVVASEIVPVPENIDFIPATNIVLPPGMYYVVAAPTTPADNAAVDWAYTTNWDDWTGTGILDSYATTFTGSWTNSPVYDYPFQLSVQATPTAGTIAVSRRSGVTSLSWPATLDGFVVESATNLASTNWQTLTNAPGQVSGKDTITNSWSDPEKFFRLRQNFAVNNLDQPVWDWDGPIGTDANDNDALLGQEFTLPAGNYTINNVTLLLNPVYGDGDVTVSIWNVSPDNNPTNEIAVVSSQSVTNEGDVEFSPSAPITLSAGSYYVVVAPTTSADNAMVGWDYTISTFWTGLGTLGGFADMFPGSWENSSISYGPFQMSIQTTPKGP
jgi:hypothetical protein